MVTVRVGTRTQTLAIIGLSGILVCMAIVAFLTFVRSDLDPMRRGISEYGLGPFGSLLSAAFAALGFGSILLGVGLQDLGHRNRTEGLGRFLLTVWGSCIALAGVLPTDVVPPISRVGIVHGILVTGGSIALIGAMFVYAQMLRNDARWGIWSDLSFRVGTVGLIAGIAYTLAIRDETLILAGGLLQRCFFVPLVSWLLITLLWLGMSEIAGNKSAVKWGTG